MRVFDLHCDTITVCAREDVPLRENGLHVSLAKAEPFESYVQCYAVFIPDSLRGREAVDYFRAAADRFSLEMERNGDLAAACRTAEDLEAVAGQRRCGGILTVESGAALGGDLDNIEDWKRRGVRMCTLTWNGENELGRGVLAPGGGGLSPFGREALRRFEKAGILADVSHASPQLFWDAAQESRKPLVASHSNAAAVCGHPRNLSDGQFAAIRESGGLVGLNFYTAFLRDEPEHACMEDVLRHAEHFLALGGEDTLALGGDMDGSQLPADMAGGLSALPELYQLFLRHFSREITDKIFFGNAARLFRETMRGENDVL